MRKIIVVLLIMSLMGCKSIAFDPAGKLGEKKAAPTGTVISMRMAASPTAELECRVIGDLNMRSAPSANASIVDYYHTGDVVTSIGESDRWRQVRNWAGVVGWANARWLDCDGG